MPIVMDSLQQLSILSYNCRGYNVSKQHYIESPLNNVDFMFIQEHWLAESQLNVLSDLHPQFLVTAVSGFDNSAVLSGRPYGGCAILWRSSLVVNVSSVTVYSRRVCAVCVVTNDWKLLLINCYMPYEDDDAKLDDVVSELSVIEDLVNVHTDCHVMIGGDFSVDFSRTRLHTALLKSFCENLNISSFVHHSASNIDYTYKFNMERFSTIDHFLVSNLLFDSCIQQGSVLHDNDNISDHDPILLHLALKTEYINVTNRVHVSRASWHKASDTDLANYKQALSLNLNLVSLPVDCLLCHNLQCKNTDHKVALSRYAKDITDAGHKCIPRTGGHRNNFRTPGWSEHVEPLRQKSLFWHAMWKDCGRPRSGQLLIVSGGLERPIIMVLDG